MVHEVMTMDHEKIGALIAAARKERAMTQKVLARQLSISEQAVSKWERGLGCPDVSLLAPLGTILGIPLENLLAGAQEEQETTGGTMKRTSFYFCPQCGDLIAASGTPTLSCCGRTLEPLSPATADDDHALVLESVEDEWFLTLPHPMTKEHYIAFTAMVTGDRVTVLRSWPEWDYQQRIPRRGHGILYWYCTQHGLFRRTI